MKFASLGVLILVAQLSPRTFWSSGREFSPLNRQGTTDRRTVVGYGRWARALAHGTRAVEFYQRSLGGVRVRDLDGRSAAAIMRPR